MWRHEAVLFCDCDLFIRSPKSLSTFSARVSRRRTLKNHDFGLYVWCSTRNALPKYQHKCKAKRRAEFWRCKTSQEPNRARSVKRGIRYRTSCEAKTVTSSGNSPSWLAAEFQGVCCTSTVMLVDWTSKILSRAKNTNRVNQTVTSMYICCQEIH